MMTFRSKRALFAVLAAGALALLASGARMAVAQDVATSNYSSEKLTLAKAYVATIPVEEDVKAAIESLSGRVQQDQRVLFRSLADSSIDYARLRAAAELNTAEIFTEAEIKQMTAFFSTPEGQSIRKKLPLFEERMQPVIMEVMKNFGMKLEENGIVVQ